VVGGWVVTGWWDQLYYHDDLDEMTKCSLR